MGNLGQNCLVMLVVAEIAWNGGLRRRVVNTARRSDARRWEELIGRVPAYPPPYRATPGSTVYYVSMDGHVVLVSEHDLAGPLRDLVLAVLAAGSPY
jgi:hypothetical protein